MTQNLNDAIPKMVKDEELAMNHLTKTITKTQNNIVKLLLQIMLTDSLKHANILRVILDIMKNQNMDIKDVENLTDAMNKHNEEEKDMMKNYEDIIDKVEDSRIKFLLEIVITDEKRHHNITERMVQLMGDSKTSENEWWDFLYRYSRLTH